MRFFEKIVIICLLFVTSANSVSASCQQNSSISLKDFRCSSGELIDNENYCDGIKHCKDGSDETVASCLHIICPAYAFRCAYGACISVNNKCNGRRDCADNSDETEFLCKKTSEEITETLQGRCKSHSQLQCKSGECIELEGLCDGKIDCFDGSDESIDRCSSLFCPLYAFRCGYGGCISGRAKCDGYEDCADGSDEGSNICDTSLKRNCSTNVPAWSTEREENSTTAAPTVITPTTDGTAGVINDGCKIPFYHKNLIARNQINNKIIYLGERVANGAILKLQCENDWLLEGEHIVQCTNNKWNHNIPVCTKHCSSSRITRGFSTSSKCYYNNKEISCFDELRMGTKVYITCASGYTPYNESSQILTCDQDGEWDFPKLKCEAKCGIKTVDNDYNDYSRQTTTNPWDVSIYIRTFIPEFRRKCSGVIISPKIVLSAQSCFSGDQFFNDENPVLYNVVEGHHTKSYKQSQTIDLVVHNVSELTFSSEHTGPGSALRNIAILVIVDFFKFSDTFLPICLDLERYPNRHQTSQIDVRVDSRFNSQEIGAGIGDVFGRKDSRTYLQSIVSGRSSRRGQILLNIRDFRKIINQYKRLYNYLY